MSFLFNPINVLKGKSPFGDPFGIFGGSNDVSGIFGDTGKILKYTFYLILVIIVIGMVVKMSQMLSGGNRNY